jgi:FKBP-type peptidyl-prolyl cis-trans isomerase
VPEPKGRTTASDAADLEHANGRESAEEEPAAEEPTAEDRSADAEEPEPATNESAEDAEEDADEDADADADADEGVEDESPEPGPDRSKYAKPIKVTPRAPLPKTPEFASGEFTPHGIGGTGRPPLKKTTKSGARLRTAIGLVTVVAVIAAGAGVYFYVQAQKPKLEATGPVGKAPKVTIPSKEKVPTTLRIKSLAAGKGPTVAKGDLAIANFVGYTWAGKKFVDTYTSRQPQQLEIGKVLPGLDKGMTGQKVGGRVMLTVPPKEGFGQQGSQQLGVKPTDTTVFVIDILGSYNKNSAAQGTPVPLDDTKLPKVTGGSPGKAPTMTIPKADAPKDLVTKTLIEGTGAPLAKGQTMVAQYEGRIWDGGKVFDSSWQRGTPAGFQIGAGKIIPGWDKGLVGKKIGSRLLLVVPPKEGYGKQGQPQGGIKGTDTLVFVIDIVGAI